MKIKFYDKSHKKIKDNYGMDLQDKILAFGLIGATYAVCIAMMGFVIFDKTPRQRNEIKNIPYVLESKESYPLDEIYLLFNDDEVIKCRQEKRLKNYYSSYDPGLSYLTGMPFFSSSPDYIYEFYDLKTGSMIGYSDYNYDNFTRDEPTMNGYHYVNLGNLIVKEGLKDYKEDESSIDQKYIDDVIEDKKYLP